jgi:hypothetical protein
LELMMRQLRLYLSAAVFLAAPTIVPAVEAQPSVAQTTVRVRAGNSAAFPIKVEEIEGEGLAARDAATGLATGKRQYKPIQANTSLGLEEYLIWKLTSPPPAGSSAGITLAVDGGGRCTAKIPMTYDASSKRVGIDIGDAARFFDSAKRPRPNLCLAH